MQKENQIKLEERLTRLESANRRLTALCILAVSALVIACEGGPGSRRDGDVADLVRAKRIEVVDANGKSKVLLLADQQGGILALNDGGGNPRVSLAASSEKAGLEIFGTAAAPNGQPSPVAAFTAEEGGASVAFSDQKGQMRTSLGFFKDAGWLAIMDEAGNVSYSTPAK